MEISLINILLLGISLGVDIFSISLAIGGYFSVISKKETFSLVGLSMLAHLIMLLVGDLLGGFLSEYIYSFAN
jgi:putative Mn2+ efflux pump MntP